MSIFAKTSAASIVLAASFFASSAQAAQTLVITGPSGTFGDDEVVCSGASPCMFTREFAFTTPTGFNLLSLTISSIANINPMTNIDFTSVTFNGVDFVNKLSGEEEFRTLRNQNIQPGSSNIIRVAGTTGGNASFSGNLSFASVAAVPEPATWMMMMFGFGLIGFSLRSKNRAVRVQFA